MNKSKCVRAKNLVLGKLHGNYSEQYAKLYAYLAELRGSNLETTTVCKLDEGRFERLYLCMQAMNDGFKVGCRPIIGLDGCHLKGYYQGHLLAAMGIDADDSIYPIAFAVVENRPEKYVHQSYFVSTQRAIYSHLISPVRGEKQWTVEETMEPILPPLFRRPPGRPHKKRKREIDEPTPQPEHVREGLVEILEDLDKHPHLLQELKESQNCQFDHFLQTRRPTTTPTSHGENSPRPRPTPTSHGGNSPRSTLLPTQPSEVHTTRWMPTPTTTSNVGTPSTTAHGGTSSRPTPLPTQPSQVHTARLMPTPTTTTHAGTPPTSAYGGTSPRPTPLPTQPSQSHTVRWMSTPTATTHLSQESSTNQPSPRVDP
ncbi:hypothetical protein V6N13_149438 [Hibiscus sabdariffa]